MGTKELCDQFEGAFDLQQDASDCSGQFKTAKRKVAPPPKTELEVALHGANSGLAAIIRSQKITEASVISYTKE